MNVEGLAETARMIAEETPEALVHQQRLDVADREAFIAYAEAVACEYGAVHQIYNNAGIASGKTVLDAGFEVYDKVIGINLCGVIHGTKVFLPHLIASGDGHVINISSLNGYMAQDELSAYCTTKFGVRGFTETLRIEMLRDRLPVKVTVVHPGGVKTNIARAGLENAEELGVEVSEHQRQRVEVYNEKLLRMPPPKRRRSSSTASSARRRGSASVTTRAGGLDRARVPGQLHEGHARTEPVGEDGGQVGAGVAVVAAARWPPPVSARWPPPTRPVWPEAGALPVGRARRITRAPAAGLVVMLRRTVLSTGACAGSSSKRLITSATTIFISCSAKAAPRQRRRPPPNGIQV